MIVSLRDFCADFYFITDGDTCLAGGIAVDKRNPDLVGIYCFQYILVFGQILMSVQVMIHRSCEN